MHFQNPNYSHFYKYHFNLKSNVCDFKKDCLNANLYLAQLHTDLNHLRLVNSSENLSFLSILAIQFILSLQAEHYLRKLNFLCPPLQSLIHVFKFIII